MSNWLLFDIWYASMGFIVVFVSAMVFLQDGKKLTAWEVWLAWIGWWYLAGYAIYKAVKGDGE